MSTIQTKAGNIILVEVPEMSQSYVVDNAIEYLTFKIPNYKNWCNDDILADPMAVNRYLSNVKEGEDWLTSGKRLHGKFDLVGTIKNGIPDFESEQFVEHKPMNGSDKFYRRYDATKRIMKFQDGDSIESGESWCGVINSKKFTATDSFLSLLKINKVDISKKYVVLKTK
jgi:hypothetical protein